MTKTTTTYTTYGPVRGCCGHRHETREAAERCLASDRQGCASQGGYSDRDICLIGQNGWLYLDVGHIEDGSGDYGDDYCIIENGRAVEMSTDAR